MENKSKKIDIKTVVIVIVTIIAVVEGIVIFTSKGTPGGLKEKDVIGTWKDDEDYYTIELYEGGSGKIYSSRALTSLTWEIKGKALNITENHLNSGDTTTGYKVENGTMTSFDGERIYNKEK